ncbi:MAG TPA: hypothetical protein VFN30_07790 [Chitinophagaceae bacterium]|nr:hypothetical protein [Chitinophagaceae bacterium]
MPEKKLKQLQYECDTWKRLLSFMIEENIHLKNRLSEVLKESFNKNLLSEIENFQTKFIKEDSLIALLRNEVAEFDKLLVREIFENGKIAKQVKKKLKKIRTNIKNAENEFGSIKTSFNNYLTENL